MSSLTVLLLTVLGAGTAPAPKSSDPASAQETPAQEAPAPEAPAQEAAATPAQFRLRSGDILWGSLQGHTPEGVEVLRLDTGGVARLPWGFLDPTQSEELRQRYGYSETESEELMVTAERIRLNSGTEVVGIVDGRTDEHLYLRTASTRVPIPLANIVGSSTRVQVPALDVYTKEELYQQRAQELAQALGIDGPEGAPAHVELAEFAEALFDYERALQHYRLASELDPEHRPDFVTAAVARSEVKAALQEQVDVLSEIDRLRARKRFAAAIALLDGFESRFPESPLGADLTRMRERVAKYQERYLREEVVRLWHQQTVKMTRALVRKSETYEDLLAALDGELKAQVEEKLTAELQDVAPGVEFDELRRFWDERERGRIRSASYGIGTWLLGEDRALAVPKEKDEEAEGSAPARGSRDEARRALEERLQRYVRNQEVQRRSQGAGGGDDGAEEPGEFWKRWSLSNRSQWALAYVVEFSGDFQVARVRLSNCRECGGTGAKEVLFTGSAIADSQSGSRLYRCSVCHGLGRVRRVQYR